MDATPFPFVDFDLRFFFIYTYLKDQPQKTQNFNLAEKKKCL